MHQSFAYFDFCYIDPKIWPCPISPPPFYLNASKTYQRCAENLNNGFVSFIYVQNSGRIYSSSLRTLSIYQLCFRILSNILAPENGEKNRNKNIEGKVWVAYMSRYTVNRIEKQWTRTWWQGKNVLLFGTRRQKCITRIRWSM